MFHHHACAIQVATVEAHQPGNSPNPSQPNPGPQGDAPPAHRVVPLELSVSVSGGKGRSASSDDVGDTPVWASSVGVGCAGCGRATC